MEDDNRLAAGFEQHRDHLRAVAYRMLGSAGDAEDAVQETWLKAARADTAAVENLAGWLTTVVGRVCLDMLRSRRSRREEPLDDRATGPVVRIVRRADPEEETMLLDSVGTAMMVVLATLPPAERVAFVLHDMFAVPFADIAPIVDRTPATAQRLASRARSRVRGEPRPGDGDTLRRYRAVEAFLRAARDGDFDALLALLDPSATYRQDDRARTLGGPSADLAGAAAVAGQFCGRATLVHAALVDGEPGIIVAPRGLLLMIVVLEFTGDRLSGFTAVGEDTAVSKLHLTVPAPHRLPLARPRPGMKGA